MQFSSVSRYLAGSAFVAVVTASTPAAAAFLGDTFKPFASLSESYDSNLFRVKDSAQLKGLVGDDQLSDFITVASVGAGLHYTLSQQVLDLVLRKDFIRFAHYSEQDVDRNQVSGTAFLSASDKVKLTLDGSFIEAPEARTDFRSSQSNTVTTVSGGFTAAYQMPSGVGFNAGYHMTSVDHSLPQFKVNEYLDNRYSASLYYKSESRGKIYAAYDHDELRYDNRMPVTLLGSTQTVLIDNSSSADSVRVGVEKAVGPKTTVSGFVGYLDRRHATFPSRDFSGVVGKVALTYAATQKLGLLLNWERSLSEETFANMIYSVNNLITTGLVYAVTDKLSANLSDRVGWKKFQEFPNSTAVPRTDFIHEIGTGLTWTPTARISANLSYQYSTRDSDDPTYEFSDHSVTTTLSYSF